MWGKRKKVENNVNKCVNIKGAIQGVWTRREIQLTRPALTCDYTCFADGTPLYKKYSVLAIVYCIRQIFLIQMEYRLQSMYNHMIGRAASVVSPLYSILLGSTTIHCRSLPFRGNT